MSSTIKSGHLALGISSGIFPRYECEVWNFLGPFLVSIVFIEKFMALYYHIEILGEREETARLL